MGDILKRKYKLILIIIISIFITYIIYSLYEDSKITIAALGDGVSYGLTAYDVKGKGYNDYLKDYFNEINKLKEYNFNFVKENYKISELINDIEKNKWYLLVKLLCIFCFPSYSKDLMRN